MSKTVDITKINPNCLISDAGKIIQAVEINGGKVGAKDLREIVSKTPYQIPKEKISSRVSSLLNSHHLDRKGNNLVRTNKLYKPPLKKPLEECYKKTKTEPSHGGLPVIQVSISRKRAEEVINDLVQGGFLKISIKID